MSTGLFDSAIVLAGRLAEAGVQTIEVRQSGASWQAHTTRVTDLPGLIAHAGDGAELRWLGGGARIEGGELKQWGAPGIPPPN